MKTLLLLIGLLLSPVGLFSQNLVPRDAVVTIADINTFDPTDGTQVNADATPQCDVYEENIEPAILDNQNATLRTGHTGEYRWSFTASTANGFEVGKYYNIKCRATVDGLTGVVNKGHFRIVAAEATAGYMYVTIKDGTGTGEIDTDVGTVTTTVTGLGIFQKNVSGQRFKFWMLDATNAAVTGLTTAQITCTISKDTTAFTTTNDTTEAEIGAGLYYIDLTQAESNANDIDFACTASGAQVFRASWKTQK